MALQDDINAFNVANTVQDYLVLAAQTANTTTNRIVSVANTASLPDLNLNTVDPGTVVFVDSIGVPVVAQIGCWTGLDNRQLRNDFDIGFLFGFGYNGQQNLADGTTLTRNSPVSNVSGFINWIQVSAGFGHTLALRSNGTLWGWGEGSSGRLGNNCTANISSPVSVVGGFTDWCQVSTQAAFTVALRTNGTAWAWGSNGQVQLGDGTGIAKSSPVSVVGGFTDWCHLSAGGSHVLGLRQNCTLWSWGSNFCGELGSGISCFRSSPGSVVGGFTDWCQASAGSLHSLGLRQNGTLWAWGAGSCGRLGNNCTDNTCSPVSVVGGFTDWCQVSAGGQHGLAIRTNGTLWSWGYARGGRLGDGTAIAKSSPVSVIGGFTNWCQVSAGSYNSGGVRSNGTLWSWGYGANGQLGHGSTPASVLSPVSVVGGFTDWNSVSVGRLNAFALRRLP